VGAVQLDRKSGDLIKGISGAVEISHAAQALGVEDESSRATTDALRELAKTCLIRFGVHSAAQKTLAQALSLSLDAVRTTNTVETSKLSNEEWRRLASKMRFPTDEPLLGAHFEVTSGEDLRRLLGEISKLREEVSVLVPLDAQLAHHAANALPRLREMVHVGDPDPKLAEFVAHCARQITLAERLGVGWTRVHPRERAFMQILLNKGLLKPKEPSTEPIQDPITDPELCNRLLNSVGMRVEFVEERGQLEPFANTGRYKNASLFSLSSVYFNRVLNNKHAPRSPAVTRFYRALCDARKAYEKGSKMDEHCLRRAEDRALQKLLKALGHRNAVW
jgi:hypothetical protein